MSPFEVLASANLLVTGSVTLTPLQLSGDFLYWGVVFFVLAIIAAVLGARGVAGVTMTVAKWFIIIFLILAILSLLL